MGESFCRVQYLGGKLIAKVKPSEKMVAPSLNDQLQRRGKGVAAPTQKRFGPTALSNSVVEGLARHSPDQVAMVDVPNVHEERNEAANEEAEDCPRGQVSAIQKQDPEETLQQPHSESLPAHAGLVVVGAELRAQARLQHVAHDGELGLRSRSHVIRVALSHFF